MKKTLHVASDSRIEMDPKRGFHLILATDKGEVDVHFQSGAAWANTLVVQIAPMLDRFR